MRVLSICPHRCFRISGVFFSMTWCTFKRTQLGDIEASRYERILHRKICQPSEFELCVWNFENITKNPWGVIAHVWNIITFPRWLVNQTLRRSRSKCRLGVFSEEKFIQRRSKGGQHFEWLLRKTEKIKLTSIYQGSSESETWSLPTCLIPKQGPPKKEHWQRGTDMNRTIRFQF